MNDLRRSILSVPGHRVSMHEKAAGSSADVVMLDLEDSCPAAEKVGARATVTESINRLDWGNRILTLRINPVDSPFALRDLVSVIPQSGGRLDTVVVPKVESAGDIAFVDRALTALEAEAGIETPVGIEVIIESAKALRDVDAIAAASPRMRCLVFGIADYSASVNMPLTSVSGHGEDDGVYPGDPLHFVYSRLIMSGKAAGLRLIDAPYGNFRDAAGLTRAAERSRALGFDGKWAIHPSQLEELNRVFAPGEEEVDRAKEVIGVYEAAQKQGRGAAAIGGSMIDQASLRMARDVMARDAAVRAKQENPDS
jgi:malyl-CoA/(S)-citramalyl-CoA lyase